MSLALVAITALLGTAEAQTYGGGGVIVNPSAVLNEPRGYAGNYNISAPGLMQCLGGQGYGVFNGKRWGGEGRLCQGSRGAMGYGGVQSGWQSKNAGIYATAYGTVGGGWMHATGYDGNFTATYLYLQPSVGMGVPLGGHIAVEGSLYWMWTLPMVRQVNRIDVGGRIPNHVGAQVSILVGDFRKRKRTRVQDVPTAPAPPAPPPPPVAPRPPAPPAAYPPPPGQPAPIQPGDATESPNQGAPPVDDAPPAEERPLAIPAGAI